LRQPLSLRAHLFGQLGFLPLLHRRVEERAGVRRLPSRFTRFDPLSLSLSPLRAWASS
jgi:hypothetical protein